MRRRALAGVVALIGALFAVGGTTSAHAAAPQTAVDSITTLPLFGAPLTVDVTSAPGGTLASVSVNPADGLTATKVKPNKVTFVNDAGTVKVQVSSRGGGQNVSAKAGKLSDISGPGGWSGDVFGDGTTTTVGFEITAAADGSPDITNVTTSDATAVIGAVEYRGDDDGNHQGASVAITFTKGIQTRVLWIKVSVGNHHDDDDESQAKVSVTLSRLAGTKLPAAAVVGPQTWNGTLCDGTEASISYTVNADGSISGATATPATATVEQGDHGLSVRFSDHEKVRIRVKSRDDGATLKVSVDEKIRCDAADPTVNTPISEPDESSDDGDESSDHSSDHSGGHDDGSGSANGGGHGHGGGDDSGGDKADD